MTGASEAFRLITRIQDEAHRFAIEYHRQLRGKGQVHSILDDIEGIGPARRKALMREYLSLDDIKKASVEELAKIPSMTIRISINLYTSSFTSVMIKRTGESEERIYYGTRDNIKRDRRKNESEKSHTRG